MDRPLQLYDLPNDPINEIIRRVPKRFNLGITCKRFAYLVRHVVGYKRVTIQNTSSYANFASYDALMRNTQVSITKVVGNDNLGALQGVKSIDLSYTYVSNKGLKEIIGAESIDLTGCGSITNRGIQMLVGTGVKHLNLSYTKVSDAGLKDFKGLESIILECTRVTDKGIKGLVGVKELDVTGCRYVTNEGIRVHKNIHTISVTLSKRLTRDVVNSLNAKIVHIEENDRIP
mmetsp:Transcript_16020/g.17787  ORF Transcript_16020/g.17787 Transcript_16020/m.17787 type:complete len:231 (+) Transcript_16020:88-780(+)